MMNLEFKNYWYPIVLFFCLFLIFSIQSINTYLTFELLHISYLFFTIAVIFCVLLLNKDKTGVLVKIWTLLSILPGMIGIVSLGLIYLFGMDDEETNHLMMISHVSHFVIGITLYRNWNNSVRDKIA